MSRSLCLVAAAALLPVAAALALPAGSPLQRALSRGRPLLVELTDVGAPAPLDLEDLSRNLRDAGATALLVPDALLDAVVGEQAAAVSEYPGPVPVLCLGAELPPAGADADAALAALRERGAAGVALRCADGDEGSPALLAAARALGLDAVAIAASERARAAADAAGACAVACDFDVGDFDAGDGSAAVALGAWDGDADELARLRDGGFSALLLLDGCGGDVAAGGAWCVSRVRAALSKASKQWGGSMFGSTNDAPSPGEKNPRMWAQSQRQANEIMHDSATSRGLEPPKRLSTKASN